MTLKDIEQGRIVADFMGTEDEAQVTAILAMIFPGAEMSRKGGKIAGEADLSHFKELVEKERIGSAIEKALDENCSGDESFIDLNKMAALTGRIGLDEESPIGKIRVYIPWKKA